MWANGPSLPCRTCLYMLQPASLCSYPYTPFFFFCVILYSRFQDVITYFNFYFGVYLKVQVHMFLQFLSLLGNIYTAEGFFPHFPSVASHGSGAACSTRSACFFFLIFFPSRSCAEVCFLQIFSLTKKR